MLPPQTPDGALLLIQAMERYYGEAFKEFKENEKFYDGKLESVVHLPEGYELTIPTTARAVVDEAIDNVMPGDIMIHYPPRGNTKKAEEDADLVRSYLHGLWRHWRRVGSDIDVIRDFGKNLFINGLAVAKLTPDWTLWPSLPDKEIEDLRADDAANGTNNLKQRVKTIQELRKKHVPLVLRSLPPLCVMTDATVGNRKLWVVERYESGPEEVKNLYAEWERDYQQPSWGQEKHLIHELWSATYADTKGKVIRGRHMIFIDKVCQFDDVNPYDELIYCVKYSGFGRESFNGQPQFKSVGFFTPQVKSLMKAEARRYSQFDAIMAQLAFPIGILPMEVDSDNFDVSPGAMNFVPDSVMENADKIWLRAPIPDGEYLNSLKVLGDQIERGTVSSALNGSPVTGTDSASQLGQYQGQAKLRLNSAQTAMEDMLGWAFSMALYFIDKVLQDKTSVFVAEEDTPRYMLGPDNIKGHYDVWVEFRPREDVVKERKLALANDAIVKGGFSRYDALEWAGFDRPQEMVARRIADEMLQEPLVKRAMAKMILRDWGVDPDQLALGEEMQEGVMQVKLSEFMNLLQSGSLVNVGNPMQPGGMEPGGGPQPPPGAPQPPPPMGGLGGQNPMAALAQQGQGPMPLPVGRQPMNPGLQPPQTVQQ